MRLVSRRAGDGGGGRAGSRKQADEDARLGRVERRRRLAGERAGTGVDADEVAAKRHEVEPRLEDLRLGPARLDRPRCAALGDLLQRRPAAAGAQPRVEQGSELHRDRACPARPTPRQPVTQRAARAAPVDPAVTAKTPILARHRRLGQRRGNVAKPGPVEAAHRRITADDVEDAAVAGDQPGLAGVPAAADRGVAGYCGRSGDNREEQHPSSLHPCAGMTARKAARSSPGPLRSRLRRHLDRRVRD